jgi:branched-chain amino acid transport system permease protein
MTGAFVGGFLLMLLPVLQSQFPALGGLEFLIIGIGAVSLGRDPNGLANMIFKAGARLSPRLPAQLRLPQRATQRDAVSEAPSLETEQVAGHGVA